MVDLRWRFRPMAPAERNQDPMEREFFSGESINERLVREAVQNSLDAGIARLARLGRLGSADPASHGPVRVRFSLQGVRNPLEAQSAAAYVDGLEEHLEVGLDHDDNFRRVMRVRGLLTGAGMPHLLSRMQARLVWRATGRDTTILRKTLQMKSTSTGSFVTWAVQGNAMKMRDRGALASGFFPMRPMRARSLQ